MCTTRVDFHYKIIKICSKLICTTAIRIILGITISLSLMALIITEIIHYSIELFVPEMLSDWILLSEELEMRCYKMAPPFLPTLDGENHGFWHFSHLNLTSITSSRMLKQTYYFLATSSWFFSSLMYGNNHDEHWRHFSWYLFFRASLQPQKVHMQQFWIL